MSTYRYVTGSGVRLVTFTFVLTLVSTGCHDRSQNISDMPNVVFITIDTLRADRVGTYGYFRDTTPVLDALSRESVVFERCFAPMATTFPSHLSLFTGTFPNETGAIANVGAGGMAFHPTGYLRTLAQLLQEGGYRTAAFVSAVPLKQVSGISAGFDVFEEPEGNSRPAEATNALVLDWLDHRDATERFFLWVHYFDPHRPYTPPEPFASKYKSSPEFREYLAERAFRSLRGTEMAPEAMNNRYDGEVSYVDREIGRLLAALQSNPSSWNNTILVVLADHGEGLRQHGETEHGGVWKEQLHVPLMMRIPGREPARIDGVISVADVVPTLMGMVHLPGSESLLHQGSGVDRLAPDSACPPAFSQESGATWKVGPRDAGPRYVLTDEDWKYIYVSKTKVQLFHLSTDPHELHDVSSAYPEVAESFLHILLAQLEEQKRYFERYQASVPSGLADDREIDPLILEQLRSLGYVP